MPTPTHNLLNELANKGIDIDQDGIDALLAIPSEQIVHTLLVGHTDAQLDEAESDAMALAIFDAVPPNLPSLRSPDLPTVAPTHTPQKKEHRSSSPMRAMAILSGLLVVIAVSIVLATLSGDDPASNEPNRFKAAATSDTQGPMVAPEIHLLLFAADETSKDLRRLADDDTVQTNQAILFRYRLSQPAFVVLLAKGSDQNVQLLWQSPARMDATPPEGEELNSGSQALALRPNGYGNSIELVMVASHQPFQNNAATLFPALDQATIQRQCPQCSADGAALKLEP